MSVCCWELFVLETNLGGDVYFETEAVRTKADARENPCRINGDNREFHVD